MEPAERRAESAHRRLMRRGAVAVLVLAGCVALSALGRLMAGVAGLVSLPEKEGVEVGSRPFPPLEFTEAQFAWSLQRVAFNLIVGLVIGVLAWQLIRYARQLRQASEGSISLEATLKAHNACLYMVAALVLLYFARVLGLPIISWG